MLACVAAVTLGAPALRVLIVNDAGGAGNSITASNTSDAVSAQATHAVSHIRQLPDGDIPPMNAPELLKKSHSSPVKASRIQRDASGRPIMPNPFASESDDGSSDSKSSGSTAASDIVPGSPSVVKGASGTGSGRATVPPASYGSVAPSEEPNFAPFRKFDLREHQRRRFANYTHMPSIVCTTFLSEVASPMFSMVVHAYMGDAECSSLHGKARKRGRCTEMFLDHLHDICDEESPKVDETRPYTGKWKDMGPPTDQDLDILENLHQWWLGHRPNAPPTKYEHEQQQRRGEDVRRWANATFAGNGKLDNEKRWVLDLGCGTGDDLKKLGAVESLGLTEDRLICVVSRRAGLKPSDEPLCCSQ